jgi:hypothetical protein
MKKHEKKIVLDADVVSHFIKMHAWYIAGSIITFLQAAI